MPFRRSFFILVVGVTLWAAPPAPAQAAWLWSPDIGKWIHPKKTAKDTPEEQFAWALEFYKEKNWDRAVEEFEKVPEFFPSSRLAAESVYYLGRSWEHKKDLAKAADAYQRLVDRYPYSDRIRDTMQREFVIAHKFASGYKVKVLGVPALPGEEKALEIYKHIVRNAPFGSFGDKAQFKIGEIYKSQGEFEEAQKAFQVLVDEYPQSKLVSRAQYQIAYCSMQASRLTQYNEERAERAIEEFEGFKKSFPTDRQVVDAEEAIRNLRAKKAMTHFETAAFYERQKRYASAKVYYREVSEGYPDTPAGKLAKKKVEEMLRLEAKKP